MKTDILFPIKQVINIRRAVNACRAFKDSAAALADLDFAPRGDDQRHRDETVRMRLRYHYPSPCQTIFPAMPLIHGADGESV